MTQACHIRYYVIDAHIQLGRSAKRQYVCVHAGTIHTALQLKDGCPVPVARSMPHYSTTSAGHPGEAQWFTTKLDREWIFALL